MGLTRFGVLQALLPRGLPRLLGCSLGTRPPGERGGHRALRSSRFSQTVGQVGGKGFSRFAYTPALSSRGPAPALTPAEGLAERAAPGALSRRQLPKLFHAERQRLPGLQLRLLRAHGRRWHRAGPQPARRPPGEPADVPRAPRAPQPLVHTFLEASGLPRREEPGSGRGRPSASARRHSRYSGDLTKRA